MAAVVMAVVVTVEGRWSVIRTSLADARLAGRLLVAGLLLAMNWTTYVWAVVNDAFKPVATFEYSQKDEAYARAKELTEKGKGTYFVQKVKEPMPDDAPGLGASIPRTPAAPAKAARPEPAEIEEEEEVADEDEEMEADADLEDEEDEEE